ncbi:putative General transcription and DNA repair factor IIH subunit SSL1 (putative) [Pseudozyma hubeiensis]|nr:putative General transcription and DNA repair factor IIH subunit SSL1 (putative) [Pseudozyma hubeiensis]
MPPRIADDEYVDDGADAYDAEDFLDDDDSGDEYRAAPSLPKLGTLRGATSRISGSTGRAGPSNAAAASSSSSTAARVKAAAAAKSKQKDQGYSWEATYKRSWDAVAEDDSGSLESAVRSMIEGSKRRRVLKDVAPVQRGIIRHLVLLVDLSASMLEKDMRPNRFDVTLQYAREFVGEYFDQNPIGQLSIIGTRSGIAERLAMMGGNTVDHTASLSNKRRLEPRGEPSLQNALEMARSSLVHLPASNSREILAIFGSLTTCDPGKHPRHHRYAGQGQHSSVDRASSGRGQGVQGRVYADGWGRARRVKGRNGAGATNGVQNGEDEDDEAVQAGVDLLQMAFPLRLPAHAAPTLCACHSRSRGSGYLCPRCGVKVCDVPTDCPVCGITIVMSTHLARSYHHLFPVPNWKAVPWTAVTLDSAPACFSCNLPFPTLQEGSERSAAANKALEDAGLSPSSRYR